MTTPTITAEPGSRPLVFLAAFVVTAVFYTTDHDANMSTLEGFAYSADHLGALTQGGNTSRQVAYLSLGAMGTLLLIQSRRRAFQVDGLLFPLLLGFILWIFTSILWSIAPGICLRRLFVFGCCLLGAAGLSRALRPRELVLLACLVSTAFLIIGVGTECVKGTFRPWAGDYRFAGTLHPNAQGMNLAVVCLSSLALAATATGYRKYLFLATLGGGLLLLLLTRSRTATAGALLGLVVVWSLRTSASRMCVQFVFGATALLLAALLAAGFGGSSTSQKIEQTILMGRAQDAGSLTGRVPLWKELTRYIVQRPLTGYGYDTFWTDEQIHAVSASQDWGIHEAHSSYIEVLLDLGMIGLMLILVPALLAALAAAVHYRTTGQAEYGFFLGLYLFGFIDGLTESGMAMPNFVPFTAACGLLLLALAPRSRTSALPSLTSPLPVPPWPAAGRMPSHV